MRRRSMTSLERVLTTLGHQEPDRVPLFLLVTMHGAKELGLTIREYFSRPEYVAEGQIRLRKKYRNDCLYGFFYAPVEIEAWGGEVRYFEDGPPNSGEPFIRDFIQIRSLSPPRVRDSACLQRVCKAIEKMKSRIANEAPIIGVAMSPFSLPVMQMGFDKYLDLIHFHPEEFQYLMRLNEEFCVEWANAQLDAGAMAICYFDPVSSTTVISREMYLETGYRVAKRTLSRIKGPTATHFASGRCLPVIDDVAATGTAVIGVSVLEDIGKIKSVARGKVTVMGNLNGIEMRTWSPEKAEEMVRDTIRKAGSGGGFILSDNHGEIPFQVSGDTLSAISEAVWSYGKYPLR